MTVAASDPAAGRGHDEATGYARTSHGQRVLAVDDGRVSEIDDRLAGEEPLEIRLHGPGQAPRAVMTTMRTPGHEAELAAGWLHAEGLADPGEIERISFADPRRNARPEDTVTVRLTRPVDLDALVARHVMATSACGVCGRASIDELASRCPPVGSTAKVTWTVLAELPEMMRRAQRVFDATGGLHATGVFTTAGQLITLREDVGRHNALDAAIGTHVLAGQLPLDEHVVLLSGRTGFELVQKAAVAGVPVVAAVGAPSDLAVRTAQRLGITLVGFLRGGSGNVYTHPHRIDLDTPPGR